MKFTTPLLAATVALVLVGCAGKPPKEEFPDCTFPQTKERAPNWVCIPVTPIEGAAVWSVGVFKKTGVALGFQTDQAVLVARARLASDLKTDVTAKIEQSTTMNADTKQAAKQALEAMTSATLTGTRTYRTAYDAAGTVYVAVGMDADALRANIDRAVQSTASSAGQRSPQLSSPKAQATLSAEIYKMTEQKMR